MICAILGRGRHAALAEEWKEAAEAGVDLVEVRVDCLRREPDLKRILANRHTPMVFTLRRGVDGGLWRGPEDKRRRLMREAIVAGVDFIDIEMDVAREVRRFGKTRRIVSYHNMKETPGDLLSFAQQCEEMDADIVKIAVRANSLADAVKVLQVASKMETPTIAIAMGEIGSFTRVLNAKYGAPFTYANFNIDRSFAPGMFHFNELRRDYYYDLIDKETEVYAVIGDPIGHSLSPPVHNAAFRQLGQNKVMVPILMPGGRLKESLNDVSFLGIRGFSITIPHKQAVLPLLTQADGAVERVAACNTMIVKEDGTRVGYNTDYRAAMESLELSYGGASEGGISPLSGKQVLILGAGGVARPIAFGMIRRGAAVTLCNRTEENATKLAEELGCRTISWTNRASSIYDVIINCTPVGMHPEVDDTPMLPAGFRAGMVAMDTVYHPENTMFLKLARDHDCQTVSGVDMFVRQAAIQSQLYTGQEPPVDLMRETVKRKLGPNRK
ncbi:shikimate dehydrogenase [Tundrisphaera lichenicola]|uniref:shikimate dehydrogenase n=1 Tax=Tundrisphaera lichenicola TaxID=2029860 RepID=UPI003EBFE78B